MLKFILIAFITITNLTSYSQISENHKSQLVNLYNFGSLVSSLNNDQIDLLVEYMYYNPIALTKCQEIVKTCPGGQQVMILQADSALILYKELYNNESCRYLAEDVYKLSQYLRSASKLNDLKAKHFFEMLIRGFGENGERLSTAELMSIPQLMGERTDYHSKIWNQYEMTMVTERIQKSIVLGVCYTP